MKMKRPLFIASLFLASLFLYHPRLYAYCSPAESPTGTFTISVSCSFEGTGAVGVDYGTGAGRDSNTAKLIIAAGTAETPNNLAMGNTQTLATGTLKIENYASVIHPTGAVIEIGGPMWVSDNVDTDGDTVPGTAGGGNVEISITQPPGKVRKGSFTPPGSLDCDDDNPSIYQTIGCFTDADGDKWSPSDVAHGTCCGSACGVGCTGVVSSGELVGVPDCNDFDPNAWRERYTDADADGFCPSASKTCVGNQFGYTDSCDSYTDCKDTGANAWYVQYPLTCYVDGDGDTYGSSTSRTCMGFYNNCSTAKYGTTGTADDYLNTNFSSNNTDCDDTNVNIYTNRSCYADSDGDGYSQSTSPTTVCCGSACGTGCASQWKASTSGFDCKDDNTNVKTGQTAYFTTAFATPTGTPYPAYDYNCDKTNTKEYPLSDSCSYPSCNYTWYYGCGVVDCGVSCQSFSTCYSSTCSYSVGCCKIGSTTSNKKQGCR